MLDKRYAESLRVKFTQGQIFAYPTEAVFGLGCDPDNESAVMALLKLKQRDIAKGLILVANDYQQLLPYVEDKAIPERNKQEIFTSWPGPNTWLLPAKLTAPIWVTGGSELIAVRVSAHPLVKELCELFQKPMISTSANVSGLPAAMSTNEVVEQFASQVTIIEGELGGASNPSMIRHGISGQVIRGS
ncbi:MAG: Sua5/YciO/YrdC/YwlC family protein [Paraglaciecola sp.]|uniref:Sua5/YciO/YrdC/YwlC family protein n=1 Tax=Pseudomonadati TaxID=3379134 RepID=UPI00273E98EC|nr:Sua5/YciO/YrdC/YwlC family protein [Paraglaciecola sp.]MDP5032676.1 Sua5/YciO/YrdC/YwlC family protein [Paraglaciecola sp.]MDP5039644.1 Sua5/YciO/YrdC/YwlC family protein [Paraglaciecola sp.]MDP5134132.1 Sua5/YciO/YrdC/YwlC family protein [Paraglaciecola sp.]